MKNLKVATWNIKNGYFNLNKNEVKAKAIIQLLEEQSLDVLALQEVNPLLARMIEEKLQKFSTDESSYKITSSYETTKNPIKNLRVEYNMIISRLRPTFHSTPRDLPYLPKGFQLFKNLFSIRKRDVTVQSFEPGVLIDNTHLDHAVDELSNRQMEQVSNLVYNQRYDDCDVILTGTLNKKPTEDNMIRFTEKLKESGMKVVENPHKTYIGHEDEQPVDYVIVPEDWQVDSVETLENYDDVSTHRPVVVEARKR